MKKIILLTLVISFSIIFLINCKTTTESKIDDNGGTDNGGTDNGTTDGIVVTFDENGCTVTGPSALPTGTHEFVLKNLYDLSQELYVSRLDSGYTYQNLVDRQSQPGVYWSKPAWVITQSKTVNLILEGEYVYTFRLNIEGNYAIYTGSDNPPTLWFGAPLRIVEVSS